MLQLFSAPESAAALSDTYSFQVPFGFKPLKIPNAADAVDDVSGLKVPVNGAVPEEIAVAEDELITVFIKLSPVPPLRLQSVRYLPSGPTRRIIKSPSVG